MRSDTQATANVAPTGPKALFGGPGQGHKGWETNCPAPANAFVLEVQPDSVHWPPLPDTSTAAGGTISLTPHMENHIPEEQALCSASCEKKKKVHKCNSEYTQLSVPSEAYAHTQ